MAANIFEETRLHRLRELTGQVVKLTPELQDAVSPENPFVETNAF